MTLSDLFRSTSLGLICLVWSLSAPAWAVDPADVPHDFRGTFVSCMAKTDFDPVLARDYAEQWLASDTGGDPYAFYCLAVSTFQSGDPVRAAEILEKLSEDAAFRDTDYVVTLVRSAGDLFDAAGELKKAFRAYTKALDKDRFAPALWVDRALIRAALGDFEGMVADLDLALALDANNVEALVFRGSSYLAIDELEAAADDALQALLIEPFNIPGLWLRAQIALASGDAELARSDLERIIERDDEGGFAALAREALEVVSRAAQKSTLE